MRQSAKRATQTRSSLAADLAGCVGAVTLVARLHPSPTDDAGQGAWSAWHLLEFVREYCPSVGVSDELIDAVRGDGAEAKQEL